MWLRIRLCLIFCLAAAAFIPAASQYRFSFHFSGSAHGRILLFIPYRAYYQASASALFSAIPTDSRKGIRRFSLRKADRTALLMRTTGLKGSTMVLLTLHPQMERGIRYGREEWRKFRESNEYFPRYIGKVKDFQFRLHSSARAGLSFLRTGDGVVSDPQYAMDVRYRYSPEVLRINFNIYRIMLEAIRLFNHSFRPPTEIFTPFPEDIQPGNIWLSPMLDFTNNLNRIAPLASRFVGSLKKFRQEHSFPVIYCFFATQHGFVGIEGSARPNVKIWGRFRIRSFNRKVILDAENGETVRDEVEALISKNRHGALRVKAVLQRVVMDDSLPAITAAAEVSRGVRK